MRRQADSSVWRRYEWQQWTEFVQLRLRKAPDVSRTERQGRQDKFFLLTAPSIFMNTLRRLLDMDGLK